MQCEVGIVKKKNHEWRKMITSSNLKEGQVKVVVYSYKGCTIIVPDSTWDMKGDLSKLPLNKQKILCGPNKHGVRKYQRVIGRDTCSTLVPSGAKVLDEIARRGYFECDLKVVFSER